jgi:hypothetical protein
MMSHTTRVSSGTSTEAIAEAAPSRHSATTATAVCRFASGAGMSLMGIPSIDGLGGDDIPAQ